MKQSALVVLLILFPSLLWPCGYDDNPYNYFYNLFGQENLKIKTNKPLLTSISSWYYYDNRIGQSGQEGNIGLWKEILSDWEAHDIEAALNEPLSFDAISKDYSKSKSVYKNAKQYMFFADKCAKLFANRNSLSWDYQTILNDNNIDITSVIDEGLSLFQNESNRQIKMRYAYQIVRALHYSKKHQDAVNFFNNKIDVACDKNEIYYYLLNQVAGCYYSLNDYEKAAYLFLQVYNYSYDKKKSASLSYYFCTEHGAEGKSHFKSNQDSAVYLFMKNRYSEDIGDLIKMNQLVPNDEKTEVLFMRILSQIETKILPKNSSDIKRSKIHDLSKDNEESLQQMELFLKKLTKERNTKNTEFWQLALSYVSFLKEDIEQAKENLKYVNSADYQDQKEILQMVYEVYGWDHIGIIEENKLYNWLAGGPYINNHKYYSQGWENFINDWAAHLYYKKGEFAKSFLIHNQIKSLLSVSSLDLILHVEEFIDKKNKSEFEEFIVKQASSDHDRTQIPSMLNYIKATYYFRKGDLKQAKKYFNSTNFVKNNDDYLWPYAQYLDGKIFSNNTKECYTCLDSIIMDDAVYSASDFKFIESSFNERQMVDYLIKLDSMATLNNKKSKLANYLLGNFYLNISSTGYYRYALPHEYSYYHYASLYSSEPKKEEGPQETAEEYMKNGKGFNMNYISVLGDTDFGFADKAIEYYKRVLEQSKDAELNARCSFMIAKCELDKFYNEVSYSSYYYLSNGQKDTQKSNYGFEQLNTTYNNTRFYSQIKGQCSYFRYYCSIEK